MLQYKLLKLSSPALRFYRTVMLLDVPRLRRLLPAQGSILDVGCGVGSVDYVLARNNPALRIHGVDITPESIDLARQYHSLPNVTYACERLETITSQFDCVLFIDVFHHVPPAEQAGLLLAGARCLKPGGFVLIKDINARFGQVSWLMDRYVTGYRDIFLEDCAPRTAFVAKHMDVVLSEQKFRLPFPNYYIKAVNKSPAAP